MGDRRSRRSRSQARTTTRTTRTTRTMMAAKSTSFYPLSAIFRPVLDDPHKNNGIKPYTTETLLALMLYWRFHGAENTHTHTHTHVGSRTYSLYINPLCSFFQVLYSTRIYVEQTLILTSLLENQGLFQVQIR